MLRHLRGVHGVTLGRMLAVDRRTQRRHIVGQLGAGGARRLTAVEHRLQPAGKRGVGRRRLEVERDHRAFEDRLVRLFAVEQEMVGVHRDILFADAFQAGDERVIARVLLRRPETPRQHFDVADRTGRELPVKVDGQFDGAAVAPGRAEIGGGERLAEAAEPSAFGGGHHAGDVVVTRLEPARAHQPRDVARRLRLQLLRQSRLRRVRDDAARRDFGVGSADLRDRLRMRPQPRLVEVRQLGGRRGA